LLKVVSVDFGSTQAVNGYMAWISCEYILGWINFSGRHNVGVDTVPSLINGRDVPVPL